MWAAGSSAARRPSLFSPFSPSEVVGSFFSRQKDMRWQAPAAGKTAEALALSRGVDGVRFFFPLNIVIRRHTL